MTDTTVQHYITTNNKEGKSTFYTLPAPPKTNVMPFGSTTVIYTTPSLLPDMSSNATADLESTAEHSQTGITTGRIIPDNGLGASILVLNPGTSSPMHRTRTLDVIIVLEGEVEAHLEDGEFRTIKQGDTFVQRGTLHKWVNSSDKPVKMFGVALEAKTILDGDGNELKEVFLT